MPRFLGLRLSAAALLPAALLGRPLAAQVGVRSPGEAVFRDVVAVQTFDKRGGLQPSTVLTLVRDPAGLLWIGTDEGVAYFTGHEWQRIDMPRLASSNQVKAVLPRDDGSLWLATRSGVVRIAGRDTTIYDAATGGLPDDTVYDLREVRSFGPKQVLAATYSGLARFDGDRFHRLPLPDGFLPTGLVTLETAGPGGTLELWAASPNAGLARLSGGRWTRIGPADGLFTFSVEAIAAAIPRSGGPRLYAAGADGVFALTGMRWERVVGAPARATRVLEVQRQASASEGNGTELWVGTSDGRLMRRRGDGVWEPVHGPSIQPGIPITSLTALSRPTGDPVIYVGLRGERLTRIMLTEARVLPLPATLLDRRIWMVRTVRWGERTEFWIGTSQDGVIRIDEHGARLDGTDPRLGLGRVRSLTRLGDTIWAAGDRGVATWHAGRWTRRQAGLDSLVVRRFGRVVHPGGGYHLYGGTDDGLWEWRGTRWERVPAPGLKQVTDLAQTFGPDSVPVLWIAADGGQIYRLMHGRPEPTLPPRTGIGMEAVTDLLVQSLPGGGQRLWAATSGLGGLRYLDVDRPGAHWQLVNPDVRSALPSDFVRDLTAARDGRIYAATPRGIAQLRVISGDSVILETIYGEDEGLPSADVLKIEFDPAGELLAGTSAGLGRLRPSVPSAEASSPLRLEARGGGGIVLEDGAHLPHSQADLVFDFSLLNYFREEETEYRTELVGSPSGRSDWSESHRLALGALAPGSYTFRVWARDYRGEVSGPRSFRFTVAAPWWSRPFAIVLALVAASIGLIQVIRWRTRASRARAAELEVRERLARASEQKFRALFDRAFDAHLLIDGDRVSAANGAAVRLFGVPDAHVLERRAASEVVPRIDPRASPPAATATGSVSFEAWIHRDDGAEVPVQVAPTPIPVEGGRELLHVVLRDLSEERKADRERRRLEDQVRESQKLESLGTLAGGIAHDFNNLLTVIRGTAELALEQEPSAGAQRRSLETILDAGDRARDLVRQILTFSRRSPRTHAPIDLGALVADLVPLLRSTVPTNIRTEIEIAPEPMHVAGDPTQLQQMLLNLSTNAEYAMRERGGALRLALTPITVTRDGRPGHATLRPGRYALLAVSDTGIGMTADVIARVFEPFFTTKPVGEGTGLGLAVLHGIVASHHGSVALHSREGEGTTFEILLPLALGGERPAVRASALPADGTLGGRLVLVDDDADVLSVTSRLLTRLGYQVTPFADGGEALAWLRDGHADEVDLVITDQTMPGITGDRLVHEVHDIRPALPVIILTGFSHLLTPERVGTLGAADVLYKPVDREVLVDAITRAMRSREP